MFADLCPPGFLPLAYGLRYTGYVPGLGLFRVCLQPSSQEEEGCTALGCGSLQQGDVACEVNMALGQICDHSHLGFEALRTSFQCILPVLLAVAPAGSTSLSAP